MPPPSRPLLLRIDHVLLAMPAGGETRARGFYCLLLGMRELEKPQNLAERGGCWFSNGAVDIHLGVEPDFSPARKAHPAFRVSAIKKLAAELHAAGHSVGWDTSIASLDRFFTNDPFGNRIEFIAEQD